MDAPRAHGDTARSEVQTDPGASVEAARPDGERTRLPVTRLLFLGALTVIAVGYTVIAFDMEWRIRNGQIGPGFFPRIVGVLTVTGLLAEIARVLLGRSGSSSSSSTARRGRGGRARHRGRRPHGRPDHRIHGRRDVAVLCAVRAAGRPARLHPVPGLGAERGQQRQPSAERAGEHPRPRWLVPALRGAPRLGAAARPCSTTTVNPIRSGEPAHPRRSSPWTSLISCSTASPAC